MADHLAMRGSRAVTAPIELTPGGELEPTPDIALAGQADIEGRSLGQIAWRRFRRDKVAVASGIVILLLVLAAIFAPVLVKFLAHPPDKYNPSTIDPALQIPKGSFGGISSHFLLGVEPQTGRDLFSRILYGAQISLLIAILATLLSVAIGVVMGILAGYFGGWVDAVISRIMDIFLAFPLLIFAIALSAVVQQKAFGLTGLPLHISVLVFIIGFFNWPYMGRIIRGQTLSLREREYVDAARSLGAGSRYILFVELLPNLVAPILVYSTLLIPTNILFEAALSFLGVGIHPPTPSWGGMLADATNWYQTDPEYMLVPGIAIFITVLAFNLLGDGLRDALDPKGR